MRHKRARLSLLVAVAAGAAAVVAPTVFAAPAAVGAPGAAQAGPTVTLLTGDKVTIAGPAAADRRLRRCHAAQRGRRGQP